MLKYITTNDKIIIQGTDQFCPQHVFECGQVFLYNKISTDDFEVISDGRYAHCYVENGDIVIQTNYIDYFVNYFDLQVDYNEIKRQLNENYNLNEQTEFGYGIRILNQNLLETIIGFVLSQNNNIKRIQNTLVALCREHGEMFGAFHKFPSLEVLQKLDAKYFESIGAGYRAPYLVNVINAISDLGLDNLTKMTSFDAENFLMNIKGVGRKVCDCILLFALKRPDVFPVDTWIYKAVKKMPNFHENNRFILRNQLIEYFGKLSGYAQQYLFYHARQNRI